MPLACVLVRHSHDEHLGPLQEQQDLSKINVKLNLQPVTFSAWREQVSGNGIPVTTVFYAPDYYGSAQYVEYFAMMPGSPLTGTETRVAPV